MLSSNLVGFNHLLVICVISCLQKCHYNFTATTREHLKPQKAPYRSSRDHSPWSPIEYSYFLKNHILSSYKCSKKSHFKAELIKMLLAGRSVRFDWVNILILLWFLNTPKVYYSFWRCQEKFFLWFAELQVKLFHCISFIEQS